MTYQIGYRKTPLETRYKKGMSGNPSGRPKGAKGITKILQAELEAKVVIQENGRKKTVTRLQAITKRLVNGALNGDAKALSSLLELLKRTGHFEEASQEASLLPHDYESILAEYIGKQTGKTNDR